MVDMFHSNSRAPHEVGGVAPLHVMGRPCQPNLAQCLPGQEQHSVVEQSQPIYMYSGGFCDIASQVVSRDVMCSVPEVDHAQQLSMNVAQNNAVQDECADSHQNLVISASNNHVIIPGSARSLPAEERCSWQRGPRHLWKTRGRQPFCLISYRPSS